MRRALVLSMLLLGCGGVVEVPSPAADATSDGVIEADTSTPSVDCPSSPPLAGTACTPRGTAGSHCSYGDAPLPECRDVWYCAPSDRVWVHMTLPCAAPESCPSTSPADGAACEGAIRHCSFGRTHCLCGMSHQWICQTIEEECPVSAPNAGTPCTGSLSCSYGVWDRCGDCGLYVFDAVCRDGVWDYVWMSGK